MRDCLSALLQDLLRQPLTHDRIVPVCQRQRQLLPLDQPLLQVRVLLDLLDD